MRKEAIQALRILRVSLICDDLCQALRVSLRIMALALFVSPGQREEAHFRRGTRQESSRVSKTERRELPRYVAAIPQNYCVLYCSVLYCIVLYCIIVILGNSSVYSFRISHSRSSWGSRWTVFTTLNNFL